MTGASSLREFSSYLSTNKYAVYVLVIMMLTYLVNQLNTFCLIATNLSMAQEIKYGDRVCAPINASQASDVLGQTNITATQYCEQRSSSCELLDPAWNATLCYWRYLGRGWEYQVLAGPLNIIIYSISGIPMGLISELNNINRKLILSICIVMWSLMTLVGGFSTVYWHLALSRIIMGIFSAGCCPFCTSLISDYFTQQARGAALGFYNWGVYVGYSCSYLLLIADRNLGWRSVYFIAGLPGVVLGVVILVTVREPERGATEVHAQKVLGKATGKCEKLRTAASCFLDSSLLLLCLGGAVRNGAGYSYAYNTVIFFDEYHPGTKVERWMSWIPLIFGSMASITGGVISDRMSQKSGLAGRLVVLILSCLIAGPFMAGVLYAPTPEGSFLCLIPGYIFGEMWIGVCAAVVLNLVPVDLRTSAMALYFFFIEILGGNTPLMITPLTNALDMRTALLIVYSGFYWLAGGFFTLCLVVIVCKQRRQKRHLQGELDKQGGIIETRTEEPSQLPGADELEEESAISQLFKLNSTSDIT